MSEGMGVGGGKEEGTDDGRRCGRGGQYGLHLERLEDGAFSNTSARDAPAGGTAYLTLATPP